MNYFRKLEECEPTPVCFLPSVGDEGQLPIRLDAVEFEARHSREHLAKLKFNYLELATKHTLLGRLAGDWEQRDWTPAQVKALEATLQPTKQALRAAKQEGSLAQEEIGQLASQQAQLWEEAHAQWLGLRGELAEQEALEQELAELEATLGGPEHSALLLTVEEARQLLDERSVELERTRHALESTLAGCQQHQQLLEWQQREHANLTQQLQSTSLQVTRERERLQVAEGGEHALRHQLALHWRTLVASLEGMLGVRGVEMVRPGQLVATLTHGPRSIPVHLTLCPQSGRLLAAHPGATSSTPQRAWKELCQQAVELNDVAWLLRAIRTQLKD